MNLEHDIVIPVLQHRTRMAWSQESGSESLAGWLTTTEMAMPTLIPSAFLGTAFHCT